MSKYLRMREKKRQKILRCAKKSSKQHRMRWQYEKVVKIRYKANQDVIADFNLKIFSLIR